MISLTDHDVSFVFASSDGDTELCGSGARVAVDSWTDAQQPNPCTPTVTHDLSEHVCLPTDRENWEDKDFADPIGPIEDFSEEDNHMAAVSMAVAGRSPKHPRTGSEDDRVDLAALLDRAADRFSAAWIRRLAQ